MRTVLIVDDDSNLRKMITKGLVRLGYQTLEAENGIKALKVLQESTVSVIIMDLIMPEKGGVETLMEVHDKYPGIKLIAISGKVETNSDPVHRIADQFGVDAVFAKPFEIFDLLKTIQELAPVEKGLA